MRGQAKSWIASELTLLAMTRRNWRHSPIVMAGLDPAIHDFN
jgi:hypothetical protein